MNSKWDMLLAKFSGRNERLSSTRIYQTTMMLKWNWEQYQRKLARLRGSAKRTNDECTKKGQHVDIIAHITTTWTKLFHTVSEEVALDLEVSQFCTYHTPPQCIFHHKKGHKLGQSPCSFLLLMRQAFLPISIFVFFVDNFNVLLDNINNLVAGFDSPLPYGAGFEEEGTKLSVESGEFIHAVRGKTLSERNYQGSFSSTNQVCVNST